MKTRFSLSVISIAAILAALAACSGAGPGGDPDRRAATDPVTLGHAAWCGTNPPSGYCASGPKR